jgi:hypothetical protein
MSPIRFPQPYRGQPRPKYPKPRKQIRNLRKEILTDKITIGLFFLFSFILLIIGLAGSRNGNDKLIIGIFIVVFIFGLFLTATIADGTKSVNKFRDDYDFDASILEEDGSDKESDD